MARRLTSCQVLDDLIQGVQDAALGLRRDLGLGKQFEDVAAGERRFRPTGDLGPALPSPCSGTSTEPSRRGHMEVTALCPWQPGLGGQEVDIRAASRQGLWEGRRQACSWGQRQGGPRRLVHLGDTWGPCKALSTEQQTASQHSRTFQNVLTLITGPVSQCSCQPCARRAASSPRPQAGTCMWAVSHTAPDC